MIKKILFVLALAVSMVLSGCAGEDPEYYYDADWSDQGGDLPEPGDTSADTASDSGDSSDTSADTGDSSDTLSDTGDSSADTGDSAYDGERPRPDEELPLPDSDNTEPDKELAADDDTTEPDGDNIEPEPDKEEPLTDADLPESDSDPVQPDADQSGSDGDQPAPDDEQPATSQESCSDNSDCRTALGESCDPETHECVQATNCYAAIQSLPHGGFYDWDDGTTQGFQTNNYWQVREGISKSGNYSFGFYSESKYSSNMNYSSLLPTADLSSCATCDIAVTFYHAGTIAGDDNPVDFAHPMCNGTGFTDIQNSQGYTTSAAPSTTWQYANYSYNNKYPKVSDDFQHQRSWDIPVSCLTSQFVFGVRFWSNSMLEGTGIVFDDLRIAPKVSAANLPTGALTELNSVKISGWACDPDRDDYLMVQLRYYKNGDKTQAPVVKNIPANLNVTGAISCSSSAHGFSINHSAELLNALGTGTHAVEVYAFDLHATKNNCGNGYVKIAESSFEITSASSQR